MRLIRRVCLLVCLAALALEAACSPLATPASPTDPPPPTATPAPRTASLSELRNEVEARGPGSDDWGTAAEGQQLRAGGGARTGDESRARIDTSDGTLVRLAPHSLFELLEFPPDPSNPLTRLRLDAGRVFARVAQALGFDQFVVETPVGTATVRGSLLGVAYFPDLLLMIVTCLEGECRLTAADGTAVDLNPGEQSEIAGQGQPPSAARPIDVGELQQWAIEFPEAAAIVAQVTPAPTPTAIPTPTPIPPESACDHAYFPLHTGARWAYDTESGPMIWAVTGVLGGAEQAAITMTVEFPSAGGYVETYTWQCDPDGLFAPIFARSVSSFVAYPITQLEGVTFPPADLLLPGYTWQNVYLGRRGNSIVSQTDVFTVVSAEPVELLGQVVEAVQIAVTSDIYSDERTYDQAFEFVLARGVGLVRLRKTGGAGEPWTPELIEFAVQR